jgi:hypothetical protein
MINGRMKCDKVFDEILSNVFGRKFNVSTD